MSEQKNAQNLDVYRDWLKIPDTNRPLNYYQLLRLGPFEDDVAKIRDHYSKLVAQVRKFLDGPHSQAARQLLEELARAMFCLTDRARKQLYDASLGRGDVLERRRRSFEQILVADQILTVEQLEKARRFADAVGLDLRDAILQQKLAPVDRVMLAYAESEGLPYIELEEVEIDEHLVRLVPPKLARQHSFVPLMEDGEQILIAAAKPLIPDVEEELRLRLGKPVRVVISRAAVLNTFVTKYYPKDAPYQPVATGRPAPKAPVAKPVEKSTEEAPQEMAFPVAGKSAEQQFRSSLMYGIIGFNCAVIVAMLGQMILLPPNSFSFVWATGIALSLGLIVGAVVFGLARKYQW